MPAGGIIHHNVIKVILKFGVCAGKSHQMIKQWLSPTTYEYSRLSSERRETRRGETSLAVKSKERRLYSEPIP